MPMHSARFTAASSIRSRVSSSATGDSELCENVYASRICRPTCLRVARVLERNVQRPQHAFGDDAAARVPRVRLAPVAAQRDQHAERNAVELRQRHDAVDRREKPVVLHQQDVRLAGEVRAGGDADRLLFLGDLNQRDVRDRVSACCSSRPSHVSGSADNDVMPASLMPWKIDLRVLVGNGHGQPATARPLTISSTAAIAVSSSSSSV